MKKTLSLLATIAAAPVLAEEARHLDAHEHGIGALNIAIQDKSVVMELTAPGADIVGFEHEATSDADKEAIHHAVEILENPLALFVYPAAAGCSVTAAHAGLKVEHEEGEEHDDHEEEHAHEEAHDGHDDHDEEHDKHDDHEHEEEHDDHEGHTTDAGHSEFHAEYELSCDAPEALSSINFAYFNVFENAKEVEVQIINGAGAHAYEVERASPMLKLEH
ncbi:hypothetical protein GCM10007939_16210 [Amylibacter marinus]|uniref:DUF2796 domain-containing protein n=1 Tax=Amylibacter marinus TaxID=1475483 RepID=A0ABQ5VW63_9RHOB|nr:DUF2796 domain-containing protein [Amylibacter marinus]GLQ35338.1 hypothetical protein GCM10007939_16210 [Amylibacter marinus]